MISCSLKQDIPTLFSIDASATSSSLEMALITSETNVSEKVGSLSKRKIKLFSPRVFELS